jgi:hypothetical protein
MASMPVLAANPEVQESQVGYLTLHHQKKAGAADFRGLVAAERQR